MSGASRFRLVGLEPDNLLAFLALLGLLRALEAADRACAVEEKLWPRAAWDLDRPPLRPVLMVARDTQEDDIVQRANRGVEILSAAHDFDERKDLTYSAEESRTLLGREARAARSAASDRADLLAALMSDGAIKENKDSIDPTPLCLLFGQGHQHFLERLGRVPSEAAPPPRGRGKSAVTLSGGQCLGEALFRPWHRQDPTSSFRWDPEEDVRYALMAGDPTDAAYKEGTQHGANRLAAVALAVLTVAPETRGARVRPAVVGGAFGRDGFSFAWPIWREPATLQTIRALLSHPDARKPGALPHLGVDHVLVARRISVGKFMNFTRARPIVAQ